MDRMAKFLWPSQNILTIRKKKRMYLASSIRTIAQILSFVLESQIWNATKGPMKIGKTRKKTYFSALKLKKIGNQGPLEKVWFMQAISDHFLHCINCFKKIKQNLDRLNFWSCKVCTVQNRPLMARKTFVPLRKKKWGRGSGGRGRNHYGSI